MGYKPWGQTRYGTAPTTFRYTGQRDDDYINLYWYGSRWYDSELGRFIQPDAIVPSVGEGNNPNAVGYVARTNYSALVVDYHENQFLGQLNEENRYRLEYPNTIFADVPTNPLAFDRYAYSLNNPTRYVDPSGHFAIVAALAFIGPVGWVAIGVVAVGAVVYYYASGGPEAFANALTPAVESLSSSSVLLAEDASTLKPGPFAGESIDARGPDRDFTDEEREAIDAIGRTTGCHTCGTKEPGTKSGHFIPDHQPANALNPAGSPQKLFPQCLACSRRQGGQIRETLRRAGLQE